MTHQTAECTVCKGPARPDPFFHLWRGREWVIHRCSECTHQFVWPSLGEEELNAVFSDAYFERGGDWVCGVWERSYTEAEAELRAEAREVLALLPPPDGRLLDIGCAGGIFLDEARATGWEVAGIEFNASMAEAARARGLDIVQGSAETVPIDVFDTPFDVVVLMDTLEHIPNPRNVLERAMHWTRAGATLLIRGPLANDPMAAMKEALRRLVRIRKRLPGYPLDANAFNHESLTRLLRDFGFAIEAWPGETHGFSNVVAKRVQEVM